MNRSVSGMMVRGMGLIPQTIIPLTNLGFIVPLRDLPFSGNIKPMVSAGAGRSPPIYPANRPPFFAETACLGRSRLVLSAG